MVGLLAASNASASIVYTASGKPDSDGLANVKATLTFGAGTLTIILQNLYAGDNASGQTISGLELDGLSGTILLKTATGNLEIVEPGGVTPDGTDVSLTHWGLDGTSGITTLTGGQPNEMIVGSAPNVNGGFDNFNPYVDQTATFTLTDSSFTANTTVTGVNFLFGTGPDGHLNGAVQPLTPSVPEPSTIFVGAMLLLPLGASTIRILRKSSKI